MALQELSTNVINTMVNQSITRRTWLRLSIVACVALLGVQTLRAQHAFEYAARVGANALLYKSDYGKPMPNYNVGMDFSWKYRSPYYVGVRLGLGVDVAASTFVGKDPANGLLGYSDNYIVPEWYDYDRRRVNVDYQLGELSETQQLIIASAPLQVGLFFGDFSVFLGARVGVPVHGCYWQRIKNANMTLTFPFLDNQTIGQNTSGELDPVTGELINAYALEPHTKAGNIASTVNEIRTLSSDAYRPEYFVNFTAMLDLNYSFKVDDNVDVGIGAYLEYDPMGYSPKVTDNTSLMMWKYAVDEHTNDPVFRREYTSVLESNRADGVSMRKEGDLSGSPLVSMYHRASVGLRISVSLWSVPLDFGKNYRKQQHYTECKCDLF